MLKRGRNPEEQRNIELSGRSVSADFTLDDIMAEFGTAAPEMPPEPEETAEEVVRIWEPRSQTEEPADQFIPEPEEDVLLYAPGYEIESRPAPEPEETDWEEESEEENLYRWPRLFALGSKRRRFDPEDEDEIAAPPPPPTPEEAQESYRRRFRRLRPMTCISWGLMLLALASVVVSLGSWEFCRHYPVSLSNTVILGIFLVQCILSMDPLVRGIQDLMHGKFSMQTMLFITAAVSAIRGFLTLGQDTTSYVIVASFLVNVSLWGEYLQVSAKLRSITLIMHMEEPKAAARFTQTWQEKDCLYRAEANLEKLTTDMETQPGGEKASNITALILTAASLVVAGVLAVKAGLDFIWAWNMLLLGVFPVGGVLAFSRTFCLASKRLKSCGAALSGWAGVKRLYGDAAVVITDDDLFPRQNLSLNGIKVFGSYSAERLLGYATALLQKSGAKSLCRAFDSVLDSQNGRHYRTGDFRTYEAGGLGGEIQNDIVLLGGLGFMDLMGVEMPGDTRLKQALYISVNGVAEGVFAISYRPSDAVRSGLSALLSCKNVEPVLATQDPLLTPAMVKMKYGIPGDYLEYPTGKDRAFLASAAEGEGQQGAFLARDSFLSFSMAVAVGRQIRRSVNVASVLSVLSACLAFLLMTVMAVVDAKTAAGAMQILVYHAIWLLPAALVTRRTKK